MICEDWEVGEEVLCCVAVTGITYSNERYRCSLYGDDKKRVRGLG